MLAGCPSGPDCDPVEGVPQRPRPFHVVGIHPGQLEPGHGHQLIDRAVEMAAAARAPQPGAASGRPGGAVRRGRPRRAGALSRLTLCQGSWT